LLRYHFDDPSERPLVSSVPLCSGDLFCGPLTNDQEKISSPVPVLPSYCTNTAIRTCSGNIKKSKSSVCFRLATAGTIFLCACEPRTREKRLAQAAQKGSAISVRSVWAPRRGLVLSNLEVYGKRIVCLRRIRCALQRFLHWYQVKSRSRCQTLQSRSETRNGRTVQTLQRTPFWTGLAK
jgi:hypothetical protein